VAPVLILVRHGRTAHNATRRLLGRLDLPLDEVGHRQASALGDVPELQQASRVISSPLCRARETAAALGPPVTVDERWIEIDFGIYDGLALDEVPAALWRKWDTDPTWAPEGGESLAQVGARVRTACEDVWEEAAATDVVVVSHVSPIKAAVWWGMGVPVDFPGRLMLDVASICRIGPGSRGPVLRGFNETCRRPSL
jgi:broad specificity phosphatase PhoE